MEWSQLTRDGERKRKKDTEKNLNERYKNHFSLTNQRKNGGAAYAFS